MIYRDLPARLSRLLLLCAMCCSWIAVCAQNVAINTDGSLPDKNAMLDIKSSNKGLLIPRISTEARLRIPNTQGLLVYDINTNSFWYNTGKQWLGLSAAPAEIMAATGAWNVTGNAGTDNTNFLGTTDNAALNIRVNNQQSGLIDHLKFNTFLGFRSGFSITSGNDNTAIGASALFGITTGFNNTAVGSNALQSNSTGYHNTAVGRFALMSNTTGYNNVANGTGALFSNTTGYENSASGVNALYNNISGYGNTAVGFASMELNTGGFFNTAIGLRAMFSNTTGFYNTAIGMFAMRLNTTGHENTALGAGTLTLNTTGRLNTAIGSGALSLNSTASFNTALGAGALAIDSLGGENTASGFESMFLNETGKQNTANGYQSLWRNTTGDGNTSIGYFTLFSNFTGSFNTAVGYQANVNANNLTNATAIGNRAIVNASNKIRLGNAAVTVIEGQVPFTSPSDGRFKFGVQDDVKGLDFIMQLHPVTYQFDTKRFDDALQSEGIANGQNNPPLAEALLKTNDEMEAAYEKASLIRRSGFIAQEVEQAALKSGYNFSGLIKPKNEKEHYSLSYDAFVVPLVKAVQEQQKLIDAQDKKIVQLQDINKTHQQKIEAQKTLNEKRDKKLADLQQQIDELKRLVKKSN